MQTLSSTHFADHLAAILFQAYQFFTSSWKRKGEKNVIVPSPAAAAFYLAAFSQPQLLFIGGCWANTPE